MYAYRKLSPDEQARLLQWRKMNRLPLHEPPHFEDGVQRYMITGACYEHRPILDSDSRGTVFSRDLLVACGDIAECDVQAWVVLRNHYHVLLQGTLEQLRPALGKLHNRTASIWNREDDAPGRRVWYRFGDRRIRSEGHYFATLNYIHANPVRHRCAQKSTEWPWSSLQRWLEDCGEAYLRELWKAYPVDEYGKGWDEF